MTEDSDRPPPLIPPHIAWPGFVVFLLAISISMAFVTVMAARSDGGARLVDAPAEEVVDAPPPGAAEDSVLESPAP